MRALRSPLNLALGLALTLLCAGCGDDETLDRSTYDLVFDAAMQAVADRDLDALWAHLSVRGRESVERSLREWQGWLRDPVKGEFILAKVREQGHSPDPDRVDLARYGSIRDAWTFFLELDPRPARPQRRGIQLAPDGNSVVILYDDPQGTQRPVKLIQKQDGWYVDDLQL